MFRYVPLDRLGHDEHVMIDGARRPGTVYALSHWPSTPTPTALVADLSAEIVQAARRRTEHRPAPVEVATIDHLDVDGVVALALLVVDGLDDAHGPLLVEAARVGDFDVVTEEGAARVAFALNTLLAREGAGTSAVTEVLDTLVDLVSEPAAFASLWEGERSAYAASCLALAEGWATIEEIPELDLAVVRVDRHHAQVAAAWAGAPLHRAAVHSATDCLRIVTAAGGRMEMRYRYESWVRLARRRPRPRVDLDRLAVALTAAERDGSRWVFDGAGAIRGALHLTGANSISTIASDHFLELLTDELAVLDRGPAAWDPYRR